MKETREKLNEAKFFLEEMKKNEDNTSFDYYLSAFISSSRSVIWIMKREHSNIEKWQRWYSSLSISAEEEVFLKKINEIRIRSEKIKPLQTEVKIKLLLPKGLESKELEEFIKNNADTELNVEINDSGDEYKPTVVTDERAIFQCMMSDVYKSIEDFPDENVIIVSERYLYWLEKIVGEGERILG
jgi:hypothetical protein